MTLRTRCFTLLETLVATTILAGVLVSALLGVRSAVVREGDSILEERAVAIARRELDLALAREDVLSPTPGSEGRFAWLVRVDAASPVLLRGSIDVTWRATGGTQRVQRTLLALRRTHGAEAAP